MSNVSKYQHLVDIKDKLDEISTLIKDINIDADAENIFGIHSRLALTLLNNSVNESKTYIDKLGFLLWLLERGEC